MMPLSVITLSRLAYHPLSFFPLPHPPCLLTHFVFSSTFSSRSLPMVDRLVDRLVGRIHSVLSLAVHTPSHAIPFHSHFHPSHTLLLTVDRMVDRIPFLSTSHRDWAFPPRWWIACNRWSDASRAAETKRLRDSEGRCLQVKHRSIKYNAIIR